MNTTTEPTEPRTHSENESPSDSQGLAASTELPRLPTHASEPSQPRSPALAWHARLG